MASAAGALNPADPTIIILEDIDASAVDVTAEQIESYAEYLGLDCDHERDLFWIAEEGLKAPLPEPWKACQAEGDQELFFFNQNTGESAWEHPLDGDFRRKVEEAREQRVLVPITLSASVEKAQATVTGTNLAGETVLTVVVKRPRSETLRDLETRLLKALELPADAAARFVLPGTTLLVRSHLPQTVAEVFGLEIKSELENLRKLRLGGDLLRWRAEADSS